MNSHLDNDFFGKKKFPQVCVYISPLDSGICRATAEATEGHTSSTNN